MTFINLRDTTSTKQEQWYLAKYHLVSTKVYNYYTLDFQEHYLNLVYVRHFRTAENHNSLFQRNTFKELSGGEARIAEMVLTLMAEAEFCIFDEPFSNISPNYVQKMQNLIQEQKRYKGIIISDHMYESIMEIADDLFLLRDGYTFPIRKREDLIHHGYIRR